MKSIIFTLMIGAFITSAAIAQKVSADKVPAAVKDAFKAKFPSTNDTKWVMEEKTDYEAEFKMNKEEMAATFDKDGKWKETETEIESSKLPPAVAATIAKEFAGYKTKECSSLETPDMGKLYEAELAKEKEKLLVKFKPTGEVVSKEVKKKEKEERKDKEKGKY